MQNSHKIPPAAQITQVNISDNDINTEEEEEKKENLGSQAPREAGTDGDYLSIAFKELKQDIEALAAADNILLTPGQNFMVIDENIGLQFESFVLQLQYFADQNYAPAHQLLGILFERGIVCPKETPCGLLLQMFGTIYHYYKFINSDEEKSRDIIDVKMVSEICDQIINNVTNPFTWHFHKGQNLTPYFSQGIEYEKMAMQASGIEARYLTSWALYCYERSAEIFEKFKLEAYYNAGMIFKNGKGLHYSQNDPAEINQRITQAQFYFEQSISYAPSLYELAQIQFGFSQDANTQKDAKEAFDNAFCFLTQTIYGCEFKFGPAYYLLSDLWINGCCVAETNKISIEDYGEILQLYKVAQAWYKKFDQPNSIINNYIDFVEKIILMKNDQKKLQIMQKPYYGLFRSKILKSILAHQLQPLMAIILTQYLKEYSSAKAFHFQQNSDQTKIKMNNITQCIIQWPFKTPLKQILQNFTEFNAKEQNPANQNSPMICQSIKAILVDEDESWTNKDVKEMLKQIIPFTENLIDNLAYIPMLDIKQEIVELYKKSNVKQIIVGNIEQQIANSLGNFQNEANNILLNCENTFKMLNYWEKMKLMQSNIYEAIVILKMQIGPNVVNELEFLQIVKDQILQKLKIDEYLQNNSDALIDSLKLQIQSAKGIYDYKNEKKLQSYKQSQDQLDSFCKTIFQQKSQNNYIGYDIIRNIIFVQELKDQSFNQVFQINDSEREMRLNSKNFLEIENSWWEKNQIIRKTFQNDNISLNLKEIQKYCVSRMNQYQKEIMQNNVNNEPILNYQYLNNDPLIHFACKDVKGQIEQYEIEATKQIMEISNELKQYFNNAIYQILLEKVQAMLNQIKAKLNPDFQLSIEEDTNYNIDEIMQLLLQIANHFGQKFSVEDVISPVSIQMIKYFLFFLEKIVKSSEQCETLVTQLLLGLYGRCPDGQMLFFLQLLNQSFLDNNSLQSAQINGMDTKVIMENSQFNLVVSLFFQQLKLFFIQQHLTRDQNSYETYTNLNIYLQLVLQLPLDLTGSFTKLAYPLYSLKGEINKLKSVISIKGLMDRFLEGGQIQYLDPVQTNKINAFTLKYVVDKFRESLLPPNTLFNQKNVQVENGLISEHVFSYGIQHNILEQYILSNKDLAGEYLAMKNAPAFNLDSKYFKGSNATEISFSFQNILTDAGILLILSQLGYVKSTEAFFTNVKLDWKLK